MTGVSDGLASVSPTSVSATLRLKHGGQRPVEFAWLEGPSLALFIAEKDDGQMSPDGGGSEFSEESDELLLLLLE